MKTREGRIMNTVIKNRILRVMTDPAMDGATQKALAQKAKVGTRTLRNYLTEEMWQEIKERRLILVHQTIGELDRNILSRALEGDLAAARLIYSRWDKYVETQKTDMQENMPQTLEDVEAALATLREEIAALESDKHAATQEK